MIPLAIFTSWAYLNGKAAGLAPAPTPTDSPLKVWDGTAWVNASAPPAS